MNPWQPPGQAGWGSPTPPGPYGAPPTPGAPYAAGPYPPPYPAAPPSGATTIAAAVLSFLGAASSAIGAIASLAVLTASWAKYASTGYFAVSGLVSFALAAALVVGGVMLLRRQLAGRVVIAAACGVAMLLALIGFVYAQHLMASLSGQYGVPASGLSGMSSHGVVSLLFDLLMPAVTMALALVPSTRLWCLAGRASERPPTAW